MNQPKDILEDVLANLEGIDGKIADWKKGWMHQDRALRDIDQVMPYLIRKTREVIEMLTPCGACGGYGYNYETHNNRMRRMTMLYSRCTTCGGTGKTKA